MCDEPAKARADLGAASARDLAAAVQARLQSLGQCGGDTGRTCEDICLCEILPAEGNARQTCLTDPSAANAGNQYGYCYIDPYGDPPLGAPELVASCPASQKQKLQFIGENTPARGSSAFIACRGTP